MGDEGASILKIAGLSIPMSLIVQWAIMIVLAILSILLTSNLKKRPDKKQSALELFYVGIQNVVAENMGEGSKVFIPFVGTMGLYILIMNFVPLVGIEAPTKDFSVTIALGAITFFVIQAYAIKKVGIGKYLKGYFHPYPVLFPLNMIERFVLPVSLGLRLYGNLTAGAVVVSLIYTKLGGIFPILQLGIPIPFHAFFDVFDGGIQMVVFVMLSMINIKVISEH